MKSIGWKDLGGWVCAQGVEKFFDGGDADEYWIEKLKEADEWELLAERQIGTTKHRSLNFAESKPSSRGNTLPI